MIKINTETVNITRLSIFYFFRMLGSLAALSLATFSYASTMPSTPDKKVNAQRPVAIAIHGGAGTITQANMTPAREKAYRAKLTEATNAGYTILASGGSSLDAVAAAIVILEDSPLFNAGHGAVYTYDKVHELDASLMSGQDKQAGAVASVTTVKNPILLAREVMDNSVHVMLSGEGAEAFARQQGLNQVNNNYCNYSALSLKILGSSP